MLEVPVKPSRMIHFLDASNEKMVAKVPDMVKQTDVLLGNLEDAIPADRKEAAREAWSASRRRPISARPRCGRGSTRSRARGSSTT